MGLGEVEASPDTMVEEVQNGMKEEYEGTSATIEYSCS